MGKGLSLDMIMNILKGLFKSNSDTEMESPTDTPSSESQNEQWQNVQQPWSNPEATAPIAPNAKMNRNDTPSENGLRQKGAQNTRRDIGGLTKGGQRTPARNPFEARPNAQLPGMNPNLKTQRQSAIPMVPQGRPQQRVVQTPGFGQTSGMPRQGPFNPGQNPFGQPRGNGLPGGFGQPGSRRQMQMYNEWGGPQQRNTIPQKPFGFPVPPHYSPRPRVPNGSGFPGNPRRITQQFQEPWF